MSKFRIPQPSGFYLHPLPLPFFSRYRCGLFIESWATGNTSNFRGLTFWRASRRYQLPKIWTKTRLYMVRENAEKSPTCCTSSGVIWRGTKGKTREETGLHVAPLPILFSSQETHPVAGWLWPSVCLLHIGEGTSVTPPGPQTKEYTERWRLRRRLLDALTPARWQRVTFEMIMKDLCLKEAALHCKLLMLRVHD